MKPLEVLNKIYDFTVRQLAIFLEDYDLDLNEFNDNILDVLDAGIQDSKLNIIYSLAELANAAEIIAGLDKLPYPRAYRKILSEIDNSLLTPELFAEYYAANRQKAAIILAAAYETTKVLKAYDNIIKSTIQEKPSTD